MKNTLSDNGGVTRGICKMDTENVSVEIIDFSNEAQLNMYTKKELIGLRNSIYMMLTRSFLTSYLILPDTAKNINLLEEGIGFVNRKGFLKVEEPSDDEKRNLANAIINRGNLHKSLFQKAEEIMDEMGVVDKEHRDMIHQLIRVRFKNKENDENKLRKFIQANSGALE